MKDGVDLLEYAARYDDAAGLLFDTYLAGRSARRHRPRVRLVAPVGLPLRARLARAGDPVRRPRSRQRRRGDPRACSRGRSTCRAASRSAAPTAQLRKGIKDAARIAAFIEGVRNADD